MGCRMPAFCKWRLLRTLFAALVICACQQAAEALAQPTPPVDDRIPEYAGSAAIVLTVRPDGTSEELETRRIRILAESAVKPLAKQSFSFTASLDVVDVLVAATEKSDGRRIPVPGTAVAVQDTRWSTGVEDSIDAHDYKQQIIIFPDVSVGDTVMATLLKVSASPFPGEFIRTISVDDKLAPSFTISFNRSRPLYIQTEGQGFTHKVSVNGETEIHTIEYRAPVRTKPDEPGSIEPRDMSPAIHISSLPDYEAFGRALSALWEPLIAPTPAIRALAEEITQGISDKRAQAAAIDRWVKRNIRYAWIAKASQALVPNPVDDVLRNRFGPCADRSALMSALLAARGIESEIVWIKKLGDEYSLPAVAVHAFDHALLYLPEFQIYADPTAVYAAFGVLDEKEYDKPVLRFAGKSGKLDRTPAERSDEHTEITRTKITVTRDGEISGETTQISSGVIALANRKLAVQLPAIGSRKQAADQLRANETPGEGRFEPGSVHALADPFLIQSWFKLAKRMETGPHSSWPIPAAFVLKDSPDDDDSLTEGFFGKRYENRQLPFECNAGRDTSDIEIHFAEGLALPKPLKGLDIKTSEFSYKSSYRLENRTLKVSREFVSSVPSRICPAALEAEIAGPLKAVAEDLEKEIGFASVKRGSRDVRRKDKQPAATLQKPSPGRG
jgi:hypothetical protein